MIIKFESSSKGLIGKVELNLDEAYEVHKILYNEISKEHIDEHYKAGYSWGIGDHSWKDVEEAVQLVKINNNIERLLA